MRTLTTLVKMQLQEKLNFKRIEISKSAVFNFILSLLVSVIKFAFVVAICYVFILVAQMFSLFQYVGIVPKQVMSFFFLIMLFASTLGCTIGLTKSLYYSRDNAVLLTLPATPMQIFLSKIIIFYIFELKRSLSFIVPLFISYFFLHGYSPIYYVWMLLCFAFVAMFTVALGALLSIPGMWIGNIFNQHKSLQTVFLILLVFGVVAFLFFAISLIPTNIDFFEQIGAIKVGLQKFFDGYAYYNPNAPIGEPYVLKPVYSLTLLLFGPDGIAIHPFSFTFAIIRLAILIGAILVLSLLSLLIAKPLFYKMASTPFEYRKRPVKEKKNRQYNKRISSLVHEMRVAIKTPDRLFANVFSLISIPVLIMLLNKIFMSMNVAELGEFMISTFNILIILLIALNSNVYAASVYSKEGRSSYLIKTQPTNPIWLILAKLVPNTLFVTVSLVVTAFIMRTYSPLSTFDVICLFLGIYFIYLTHLFSCAESDIMNPQIEIYATVGSSDSNPNETKATALAFGAAFAVAIIVMLLLLLHENQNVYFKVMLVSLAVLIRKLYVFFAKVRLYYKEK